MAKKSTPISQVASKLLDIGTDVNISSEEYRLIPADKLNPNELKIVCWMMLQQEINQLLQVGDAVLCKGKMLELTLISMELTVEYQTLDFICNPSFLRLKDEFVSAIFPNEDLEDCVFNN